MDALQVTQLIEKLQALVKQGKGDLICQFTTPCGLVTPISDVVILPAGYGQVAEVR